MIAGKKEVRSGGSRGKRGGLSLYNSEKEDKGST